MYRKILLAYDGSPDGDERWLRSRAWSRRHRARQFAFWRPSISPSSSSKGWFSFPTTEDTSRRLLDSGVKRLQRVVAVKSRTINSNVRRSGKMRARREESAMLKTSTMSTLLLLLRTLTMPLGRAIAKDIVSERACN